jgi:ATP-dependent exoDNAse (exonuclease V) beta subunit
VNDQAADLAARRRAIDPGRSFIVEAPAGSGKTELLTQRLLRLLDCVELPEQVLAITFTRKAAAEMRQRVVETLRAASSPAPQLPAHRRESIELARAVLARSARLGWSLKEQTQRLRILTIDALNMSLARQLPLLTGGVVGVRVTDNAEHLYRQAARRTAESIGDDGPVGAALRRLLEVADNSLTTLESWLASSLPQRDRWIRELKSAVGESLAAQVEANLARVHGACTARLETLAGRDGTAALRALLDERHERSVRASNGAEGSDRPELWREAAALLLTGKGAWRQRFTRREGFASEAAGPREELDNLLERFKATAGFHAALVAVAGLPPRTLDEGQRLALDALPPLLKRLLAELKLVFAASEYVDHVELALAAQEALGAVDAPSDLLLALDRRIEHILVDEFQDTSHLQWGLLERLTAGWQADDGRSLFLVGDPMQSIYRFRDADLSLFVRAWQHGIGAIRLEPLRLKLNYRSASQVVEWANTTFPALFPAESGLVASGPPFSPAVSARGSVSGAGVTVETRQVDHYAEEIARVVEIVKAEREKHPEQSIGILVRSRTHLIGLRAALARERLTAQAVEIDSLADTELGLDLIALTAALLHEGDRLAWLAVLRGPCCGLTWADLHRLIDDAPEHSLRELIRDPSRLDRLSADGRERAAWLAERLSRGDGLRGGLTLGAWIRECWLLIDGPACVADPDELRMADSYFRQLDALARNGDLDDPVTLQASFARSSLNAVARQSGIEIMTIHKAKGLEFDTVVLPGLSRGSRRDDPKLLSIHDLTLPESERICLLAAMSAKDDPLLRFLGRAARVEEQSERSRLLYVAATRARRRLYLLATLRRQDPRPQADSLLALLDRTAATQDSVADDADDRPASDGDDGERPLRAVSLERLRSDEAVPWPPRAVGDSRPERGRRPEFEWAHPAAVQIGTLIHRELQRLCEQAAVTGKPVPPQAALGRFRRELALLGIEDADLEAAAERVSEALGRVWSDPVGREILHPWPEGWSELGISWRGQDRIEHLRIDRSYVDAAGVRWIIDYKSGRHLGADVDAFLASEVARYRPQLERYAEAVAAIDGRPIRVGLYFPLLQRLLSWVPAAAAGR